MYEAAKFLVLAEKRYGADVHPFLNRLADDAKANYEQVKSAGPGGDADLAEPLESLRNHFFHYAELVPQAPQHEALTRAMNEHADLTSRIWVGDRFGEFRAEFADDIGAELASPGDDEVEKFIREIAATIRAYWDFAHAAIEQYLTERGLVTEDSLGAADDHQP